MSVIRELLQTFPRDLHVYVVVCFTWAHYDKSVSGVWAGTLSWSLYFLYTCPSLFPHPSYLSVSSFFGLTSPSFSVILLSLFHSFSLTHIPPSKNSTEVQKQLLVHTRTFGFPQYAPVVSSFSFSFVHTWSPLSCCSFIPAYFACLVTQFRSIHSQRNENTRSHIYRRPSPIIKVNKMCPTCVFSNRFNQSPRYREHPATFSDHCPCFSY